MILRSTVLVTLITVAASIGGVSWAEESAIVTGSVVPDRDPFYAAPSDLGSHRDGKLISSREITAQMSAPVHAWQLAYRTNDSHGAPELAVATLLVPLTPWTGPGRRPAVSEQIPEDSTSTRCAPSYGIATGTLQSGKQIDEMLAENWAVLVPDFEGPKSAFLAGPQAGHAVLDGIRAAEQFEPAGIGPNADWALDGYSGGAAATGWAAELQPSYAPELKFVGAAIGGVPADLPAVIEYVDGGPFAGFIFGAMVGYNREFPDAHIDTMLNDHGRVSMAQADDMCVVELLTRFPFHRLAWNTIGADPLHDPRLVEVLRANSLGTTAPTMPIYNYHADSDEVVPVGQADELIAKWRRGGTRVVTARDPIGEHALEAGHRQPAAQAFLQHRFTDNGPATDVDMDRTVSR
ncbi:lipase family protein [Nocardia sp. CWNU-33]|uniref:lipase family protein n=1 Tax=Nocardia sp. CWNU-33 TaxID=3392117 RepID=UPI00398F0B58